MRKEWTEAPVYFTFILRNISGNKVKDDDLATIRQRLNNNKF
jgi:hypothetical protein